MTPKTPQKSKAERAGQKREKDQFPKQHKKKFFRFFPSFSVRKDNSTRSSSQEYLIVFPCWSITTDRSLFFLPFSSFGSSSN